MPLLPKFEYHEPENIDAACSLLNQLKTDGKIIAGGTDVLVNLKTGKITLKALISIARLSGLSVIEQQGSKIWIGSQTIVSDLAENKVIKNKYPILSKAASTLGSPLIRNRATIGGNIVTARPAADLIPPLMALGATVELKCDGGTREVLLEEFLVGPGQTKIRENEILTKVILGEMPYLTGGDYVQEDEIVGEVDCLPVKVRIKGILRGLIRNGLDVREWQKLGDVDPRGVKESCYTISDKARAIGGGVLEGMLMRFNT